MQGLIELKNTFALQCESFEVFEEIDSTSTYLMNKAREAKGIHIVIADHQTRGRGQHERIWHSPKGQNIYLSVLIPFKKNSQQLQGLSIEVGELLIHTLQNLGIQDLTLKWPNDILCCGRKLAGILVETTRVEKESCIAIIGIGLNVNMRGAENISQPWTSLALITGQDWEREYLIIKILETLLRDL